MKTKLFLFIFMLLPLYSCEKEKNFDYTLYLNYLGDCQVFKISIDDQLVFNDEFCSVSTMPKIIVIQLKTGKHTLKAEASGVSGKFEETSEFTEKMTYGYLTFHPSTSEFTFFQNSTGEIE